MKISSKVLRRAGWGVGDQAFSSLTNFAVGATIARELGPAKFGAFALVLAMTQLVLNLSRAIATEPQLVRYSGVSVEMWRSATAQATGVACVLGVVVGLGGLTLGLFVGDAIGQALIALGAGLPAMLIQDAWRFSFIARGKPEAAFLSDFIWAIVIFPLIAGLLLTNNASILSLGLAYVAGAAVAAIAGFFQSGVMLSPGGALSWLREHRDLTPSFIGEVVVGRGAGQLSLFLIAGIVGLAGVGSIRAAQIILGIPFVFLMGLRIVAVPEAVRASKHSTAKLRTAIRLLGALSVSVMLICGAAALAVPEWMGRAIFAKSWLPARAVLLPVILWLAGFAAQGALTVGLRAIAAARRSFRARILSASSLLLFGTVGALVGGTSGAAWGHAVGSGVGVIAWAWELREGLRDASQSSASGG